MHRLYIILMLALSLGFTACGGSTEGGGTEISAEEKARHEVISKLPRRDFNSGGVKFSLADIDDLKPMNPDSVPWSSYMQSTDANGQIHYYFVVGHRVELAAPQMRVEYMSRKLKNCSSVDSLFWWLKDVFVNDERQGEVIGEDKLTLLDGETQVDLLQIATPKVSVDDTIRRSPKHMAWAYVEQGERFVGFNFSATDKDDYTFGLPLFKDLVRSYKE